MLFGLSTHFDEEKKEPTKFLWVFFISLRNILFLCGVFNTVLFSQNVSQVYYPNINLAEHFFINKKYYQADSCYKIAFSIDKKKGYNLDYLTAAINSFKISDTATTNKYLENFALKGGNYLMLKKQFKSDLILEKNALSLYDYIIDGKNKELKKTLKKMYKNYENTINLALIKKIRKMYFQDQYIARGLLINIFNKKKRERIMYNIDRKNAKKIISTCKVYGWLGFDLLGEYRQYGKYRLEKIDVLLRHFSKEELDVLKPYILSSIKSLNYYPCIWAGCLDYSSIKEPIYNLETKEYEMKQIYGTLTENVNGKIIIIPFGEKKEMEKNRQSLYLGDIEDYCKIRKIDSLPNKTFISIKPKNK